MTDIITVVAIIKAKPGEEDRVKQALLDLIPPTRKETGCINYDMHVSRDDPGRFIFLENWSTQADLDRHLASEHLSAAAKETLGPFTESVEIITAALLA